MSDKELVWVPANVAEHFKAIEDGSLAEDYILAYVKNLQRDIETSTECLDEDIALLKARGIAYKRAFAQAFEEEQEAILALWEESQTRGEKAKADAREQTRSIRAVTDELAHATREMVNALDALQTWKAKDTLEMIKNLKAAVDSLTPSLRSTLQGILNED